MQCPNKNKKSQIFGLVTGGFTFEISQIIFICSKSTIETLEKGGKYPKS